MSLSTPSAIDCDKYRGAAGGGKRLRASLALLERMPRAVGADDQAPPRPLLRPAHSLGGLRADEAQQVHLLGRAQRIELGFRQIRPDLDQIVFRILAQGHRGRPHLEHIGERSQHLASLTVA